MHDLSLVRVGLVRDAVWIGTLLTLLPWGLLVDRIGERLVLAAGVGGCGAALVRAGFAGGFGPLVACSRWPGRRGPASTPRAAAR